MKKEKLTWRRGSHMPVEASRNDFNEVLGSSEPTLLLSREEALKELKMASLWFLCVMAYTVFGVALLDQILVKLFL